VIVCFVDIAKIVDHHFPSQVDKIEKMDDVDQHSSLCMDHFAINNQLDQ
jgi:hypothetical protein